MAAPLPKLDPDVKIPAAVKAAGKLAEDKHKEVYSKPAATAAAEEPKEVTPAEEPKKADAKETPEPTKSADPAPASTAEAPPKEVTSQGNQPPAPEEESWKHRYDSMKGRFDRSQAQIRDLSEQISQLQRLLAAKPVEAPKEVPAPESFITPEEENDYGKEFLGVVGKKAKEVVSQEVAALRQQVAQLKQQLEGVGNYVTSDAQTRFYAHLDSNLPKWRDLNNDPNFISWLKLPDLYSGAIRHDLLKAAYERNDAPRVLAFFNGFLAEEAVVDPAKPSRDLPVSPGTEPSAQGKVPLADLAAPGRAKSTAATSAPAEKPIITRVQISQFYNDVSAGKYRGREAEKDRLEKMIFEAEKDGRIR